jgi:hypothetical protein
MLEGWRNRASTVSFVTAALGCDRENRYVVFVTEAVGWGEAGGEW